MNPQSESFDAEALYHTLLTKIRGRLADLPDMALVGIRTGGAWIAERMTRDLGLAEAPGFIDISFYRDDFSRKGLPAAVKPTRIPFDVENATILLIDDVLYTGRTTRAAINELFDYGRPARILLATLIDRGDRELPIAADFAALAVSLPKDRRLELHKTDNNLFFITVEHV